MLKKTFLGTLLAVFLLAIAIKYLFNSTIRLASLAVRLVSLFV